MVSFKLSATYADVGVIDGSSVRSCLVAEEVAAGDDSRGGASEDCPAIRGHRIVAEVCVGYIACCILHQSLSLASCHFRCPKVSLRASCAMQYPDLRTSWL